MMQDDTFTRGSFSAKMCSANGGLHHVICAFQLMTSSRAAGAFPRAFYSFCEEEGEKKKVCTLVQSNGYFQIQ